MKIPNTVTRAVGERIGGGRPSVFRASMTAAVVGGAVAATVYRALRS
jgi:hypothetical protein